MTAVAYVDAVIEFRSCWSRTMLIGKHRKALLGIVGFLFAALTPARSQTTTSTITGAEQSTAGGVWDSGQVTVTVAGTSEIVPYGQASTAASIAAAIAAKFNLDSSAL
jgi:hypothetical protein